MNEKLETIYEAILSGDQAATQSAIDTALQAGFTPGEILAEAMIPAMDEVGQLFEEGEFFVPEMLISARAMQHGLIRLKPLLVDEGVQPAGRVLMGTVKGDMHDVGKNLVSIMLEGAGFEIIDLGVNVSSDQFIRSVADHQPDILGMSALLTTTMAEMKITIDALTEAGLRSGVKIIVGGAPLTDEFASGIGADGFAPDASRAVTLAKKLMDSKQAS